MDFDLSAEELAEKLSMVGLAVEKLDTPVPGLENATVGKIIKMTPLEGSGRLFVCKVDIGRESLQIISGASNICEGMNVPVLPAGSTLPSGQPVKVRVFQGEKSEGIICSGKELGTDDWGYGDEKGVLILDPELLPGTRVDVALGLDDKILEFELTPNRGDCLAVINIAREIKALTGGKLNLPDIKIQEMEESTEDFIRIRFEEPSLCRRYSGRIIRNITVASSPRWLQYRLRVAGIRPINNIVDVTNYVMLEMGQPLHAFDYERLHGAQIVVRKARQGEKIVTLDGITRDLKQDMLVIADSHEPVAIAGVMGGLASEVTEKTKTVFLESACFDPLSVRITAKLLGMRTESSQRFEKGVDITGVVHALDRAAQLISELGAGYPTKGVIDKWVSPLAPLTIRLRTRRVNNILGTQLSRTDIQEILSRLSFDFEICGTDSLLVKVPSYRVDIFEEIDLIEEVARLYGYENIPPTIPVGVLSTGSTDKNFNSLKDLIREIMIGSGLDEVITYSFINESSLDKLALILGYTSPPVRIQNPLREDQSILRPSLVPGLVNVLSNNYKKNITNLGFFELGSIFESKGDNDLPDERQHLGIAVCGKLDKSWQEPVQERDFYYVKGIVEELLEALKIKNVTFEPLRDFPTLHPGRSAKILVDHETVGYIGELHPDVLEDIEILLRVVVCELDLNALLCFAEDKIECQPLPRFPNVVRDLAVLVPENVPAVTVQEIIKQAGGELLKDCKLFDVYRGTQVPSGYRSLAYSLTFQSLERTLTDEEVSEIYEKIVQSLETLVGVRLRL